jgi:hypothetical protein
MRVRWVNLPRGHTTEACCLRRHLIPSAIESAFGFSTNPDVVCQWQLQGPSKTIESKWYGP